MVVEFVGGPQDGLVVEKIDESTYEYRFSCRIEATIFVPSDIKKYAKSYVYRREVGSDKFWYIGIR